MAITTASLSGAIISYGQARYPGSQVIPKIAPAVARSILSWVSAPVNVTVQGVTAGTAGVGTVNGKILLTGAPNLVSLALQQAGVTGPSSSGVGLSVGAGVLSTFNASAQYSGASAGVGTGSDTSKVSNANSAALIPIILGNLNAQAVAGVSNTTLATGLANGIASLLLTGTGLGGVVGSASPVGAAGTSVSVVF
jgi:hypothetical protein